MYNSDPEYIVQGCYSDSRICASGGCDNGAEAVRIALNMSDDPCFEGDYVVVITRDGELVLDTRTYKEATFDDGLLY